MYRAGHKSPAAAAHYQHATRQRDREIADRFGELATKTAPSLVIVSRCQVPVPARHFGSGTYTTLLTRGPGPVDLSVAGPAVRGREGTELLRAVVADRVGLHDRSLVGDLD